MQCLSIHTKKCSLLFGICSSLSLCPRMRVSVWTKEWIDRVFHIINLREWRNERVSQRMSALRAKNEQTGEHNAIYIEQKQDDRKIYGWERARTWRPLHTQLIHEHFSLHCLLKVRLVWRIIFSICFVYYSCAPKTRCKPACTHKHTRIHAYTHTHGKASKQRQHTPRMFHIAWSIFTVTPIFKNYNKQNYCRMYACFALLCSALFVRQSTWTTTAKEQKY